MTKLRHFDNLGTARFITFSTYRRHSILAHAAACQILVEEIDRMRMETNVRLLGYVFMPEHVHLVIHPPDELPIGKMIGQLKGRSAMRIGKLAELQSKLCLSEDNKSIRVWQRRCYDHNCRTPLATREKIEYCHKNPVVRGLVKEPGQWQWSSYNWYQGESDVPITIDSIQSI